MVILNFQYHAFSCRKMSCHDYSMHENLIVPIICITFSSQEWLAKDIKAGIQIN